MVFAVSVGPAKGDFAVDLLVVVSHAPIHSIRVDEASLRAGKSFVNVNVSN